MSFRSKACLATKSERQGISLFLPDTSDSKYIFFRKLDKKRKLIDKRNLHIVFILCLYIISISNVKADWKKTSANEIDNRITELKSKLQSNPDSSILLLEQLATSLKLPNDSINAKLNYLMGIAHYYKGNYYISNSFYNNALQSKYAQQNKKFKGACLNNIGVVYELTAQYKNALHFYLQSLEIENELNNHHGAAQTQINIGLLYHNLNQIDESIKHLNLALEYFEETEDHENLGLCYHNLGKVYMSFNDFPTAFKYHFP